ncbi:MAG: VWA domain-containing protein [Planctomycetota bacterium]|nr:VWA domain-containing protein [Planctomycetota bacterium]
METVTDQVADVLVQPLELMPTAKKLTEAIVVKGAVSGVGTAGASGAVDRLAAEINGYLEQRSRKTVVFWLFDQSVSLAAQRKEIASRLDRVFDEIGVAHGGPKSKRLLNMVVGYGKNITPITKEPTNDCQTVVEAIRSIEIDESGVENTFTAIGAAAEAGWRFRNATPRENVLIIVFTDEVGNDEDKADQATAYCQKLGIPVYVVGVPAPFGQRQVKIKFIEPDPDYDQSEQWAVVEQGPETLYPEVVRIRSGRLQNDAIDSGFGPFSLNKLCAATGGIYFAVHPNRNASGRVSDRDVAAMASQLRHFFDPELMQQYRPDYRTKAEIESLLAENRAKKALVEAAKNSEISPMESPTTTFPRKDDGDLARLLGLAQRDAALLLVQVDRIYEMLEKGLNDRPKIKEKRWQAGYDLALGRVLALKVRTDAYNSMLGQAKAGMKFQKPESDTWELVPADDVSGVDSRTQKMAAQAKELLERVVAEHAGTPWALLASEELKTPIGYQWEERHTGVNKPAMNAGNNNNNPPAPQDDQKKKLAPPKPKRNLKNV